MVRNRDSGFVCDSADVIMDIDGDAYLLLQDGRRWVDAVRLIRERVTTVGRSGDNDIEVDDSCCSRRHCAIAHTGTAWLVKDLGSHNGTRVNGKKIDGQKELAEGDVVRIGKTRLVFMRRSLDQDSRDQNATVADWAHASTNVRITPVRSDRDLNTAQEQQPPTP